ncbi:MAG: ribonuclease Z [Actinomycetota bacterium]
MRELVVLGTSGQVPTRRRNLNGYLLRWDDEGLLFDPGEGTQRQMLLAGVRSSSITKILLTHFHGDHCMGLPGVVQRLTLDDVARPVAVYYPAGGQDYLDHLIRSSIHHAGAMLKFYPVQAPAVLETTPSFVLSAMPLDHRVEAIGYRLEQPPVRHMLADRLDELGIAGSDVGALKRRGSIAAAGRQVMLDEVTEVRAGQKFAFVMDTRLCDAAFDLARDADMLLCESTYLSTEQELANQYGHMTAADAARVASEVNVRLLVLTHFSQRYDDTDSLLAEARAVFPNTVAAKDLTTIALPPRR